MSEGRFIQLLQALLTMVDPSSPTSVACVKNTLENVFALARESHKVDAITLRVMAEAIALSSHLINNRDDFAGKPGDHQGNYAKQQRLVQMLRPSC